MRCHSKDVSPAGLRAQDLDGFQKVEQKDSVTDES